MGCCRHVARWTAEVGKSHRLLIVWSAACLFLCMGHSCMTAQETNLRGFDGMQLRVDQSLEVEVAAGADLIKWPIVADWDSAGRLVVAECGGVGKPIAEHNKQQLHRIVRLVDTNGDGKFDKRMVAADKLAFPEGVLCVGNSLLVSAPPQIWKLTDANGDGICEQREIWFDPGTLTGCANDLHGPFMGRDGWIYWCKGAFAEQQHQLTSGKELVSRAAHIFRRRFEGGPVEPVMTGGMDNPVEMAISHTGERFFTSTFLQHPADGKRDGIAHALYGGVYGKTHDVIDGHRRTGDLLPIMTHLGPAAPSGLICLESTRLLGTNTAADTLVAAQFNLHKVTAHQLFPRGAGFVTKDFELLGSERIDFHPTDVIESPDGSLLVIDTGGWYNLCCPSSHVDQSIASGGIYRLTSHTTRQVRSQPGVDWERLSLDQAIEIVSDAQPELHRQHSLLHRQQALWRICRINTAAAHAELLRALTSNESSLRQIAAHAISVQRIESAEPSLEAALTRETESAVSRALAEALGRLGNEKSISVLLEKIPSAADDRMLEHSLLYAIMEIDRPSALAVHLRSANPDVRRAAMLAIDQSEHRALLTASATLESLLSEDAALSQCSAEILVGHSQWAASNVQALEKVWDRAQGNVALRNNLARVLAAWSGVAEIQTLIAQRMILAAEGSAEEQLAFMESLAGIRNQKLPAAWTSALVKLLEHVHAQSRPQLIVWLSNMKIEPSESAEVNAVVFRLIAATNDQAAKLRLVACLNPAIQLSDRALEKFVVEAYLGHHGGDLATEASGALSRLQLNREAAEELITGLPQVPPLQLPQTVKIISNLRDDSLDSQLLNALGNEPAARTLALDQLTALYRTRSEPLQAEVRKVVETLGKPPADVEAKLDGLMAQLKSGDAARGYQVFRSTKAACSACHKIGYVGGLIGPELTRIGATRSRRALLEAIVFPNARLEQSYTPLRVLTTDGQIHNGIVARDSGGVLELVTGANQRVSILSEEIEQRLPSPVSIMPAGLEQQLSLEELADLLTLLESAGTR